jgi:hypothetical protein
MAADQTQRMTDEEEACLEEEWRRSGRLHCLADRLGLGLLSGEVSPALAWVHKALLDVANGSIDTKPYAKQAVSLVRYLAVREAHDRDGLSLTKAAESASKKLRGWPAGAAPGTMKKEYKLFRKALRAAGIIAERDKDSGYRWVERAGISNLVWNRKRP